MPATPALLVNLLGFLTGTALYAMLVWMVLAHAADRGASWRGLPRVAEHRLALLTGLLGLTWNVGALVTYGLPSLGWVSRSPLLAAAAFSALGFLPAVVVHTLLSTQGSSLPALARRTTIIAAYALSSSAAALHVEAALVHGVSPSRIALFALTVGFVVLTAGLLTVLRRQAVGQRALWAVALSIFAVSALHLTRHDGSDPWWVEVLGEHASLPLAAAILAQDYRFALADIFLKRAVALILLMTAALAAYVGLVERNMRWDPLTNTPDVRTVSLLLALWVLTALVYPLLRQFSTWLVDRVMLRRADYEALTREIAEQVAAQPAVDPLLDAVSSRLAPALNATGAAWRVSVDSPPSDPRLLVSTGPAARELAGAGISAVVWMPTVDPPFHQLCVGRLAGGRRLLSGDIAFLEGVALLVARRVDALRVAQERFERTLREEHMSTLAAEAELRALRARLNPHFLFNALTTIGYLIEAAPTKAVQTLMRLTELLRAVLKRSTHEFVTVADEVDLVRAYLEVEQARFEERLRVEIDVPDELRRLRIPTLLLQPLVENAIKHGISPAKHGGDVRVVARTIAASDAQAGGVSRLVLTVRDTGVGLRLGSAGPVSHRGVGLSTVEQRLTSHYGALGSLTVRPDPGGGTLVTVSLPAIDAMAETPHRAARERAS